MSALKNADLQIVSEITFLQQLRNVSPQWEWVSPPRENGWEENGCLHQVRMRQSFSSHSRISNNSSDDVTHTHMTVTPAVGHCWMLTAAWKHLRQRQAAILSAVLTRLALTPSTPSHHVQCSHVCPDLFCLDLQSSSLNIWSFCTVEFVGWFVIELSPLPSSSRFLKSSAALLPPADQLLTAVTFLHWPEAKLNFVNFFSVYWWIWVSLWIEF